MSASASECVKKQDSKALVVIVGTNLNIDDIMSSKIDNDSPISCTAIPQIKGSGLTSESPLFQKVKMLLLQSTLQL